MPYSSIGRRCAAIWCLLAGLKYLLVAVPAGIRSDAHFHPGIFIPSRFGTEQ